MERTSPIYQFTLEKGLIGRGALPQLIFFAAFYDIAPFGLKAKGHFALAISMGEKRSFCPRKI